MSYSMFNRGKYWAVPPTLSDGDVSPAALDVNSNLKANVVASVLPTGASTAAKQDTGNTSAAAVAVSVASIDTKTPASPATSAKQDTGNTSLSSIDGKLPALSGGNVPVVGPLTDTQLRATAVPVTANAGTNLNTSLLAVESGGNLAAAKTDLDTLAATVSSGKVLTTESSAAAIKADLDTLAATVSTLRGSIKVFPGNPTDTTVMQEILIELRAMRRLLMMVYEEAGQGDPTHDLMKD